MKQSMVLTFTAQNDILATDLHRLTEIVVKDQEIIIKD